MSPKPTRRTTIIGGVVAVLIGVLVVSPALGGPSLLTLKKAKRTFITKKRANKRFLPKRGEIRWAVPPSDWVAADPADVNYFTNVAELAGTGAQQFFNAPIQIPVRFLGRTATLKSIELCYDIAPGATLDAVQIARLTPTAADSTPSGDLLIDADVSFTDETCRTFAPASPVALGANDVIHAQLRVDYSGASALDVSRLTAVLGF